jgi:hypothetical protein
MPEYADELLFCNRSWLGRELRLRSCPNTETQNLVTIERSDARKEALEEIKAAVEFANVAPDKVGTFKDGHDTLKAQILHLLRSKLDQ